MAARYGSIEDDLAAPVDEIKIPAIGDPSRYPGAQKDVLMLMAPLASPGPDRVAIAVDMATKNYPFPAPLNLGEDDQCVIELLTGHIAKIVG